jgi:hypothetical protein
MTDECWCLRGKEEKQQRIKLLMIIKLKPIPLQALTSPEGSRRLRLPDFKTIGT